MYLIFPFVYELLKVAALYVCEDIELLNLAENLFSGFKSNLTAVASANLIAVVLAGLWLAVTMIPASQPSALTAQESIGVGISSV